MASMLLPYGSVLTDVFDLILRSGIFAKLIVLILATLSVLSWAIMWQRDRVMARAERIHKEFWRRFESARRGETAMDDLAAWCKERQHHAPLAAVFTYFSEEFWPTFERRKAGPTENRMLLGMLSRGVDRIASEEMDPLARPLTWLATFASVSPFLGLLGTVWGILNSFLQLGRQGSATLDVVGPGIAEALITTVAGLAVAIPAVVGYNAFMRRLESHNGEIERLSSLLADLVTDECLESLPAKAY